MAIPPSRRTSQVPQLRSPLLGASKKVIRCDLSFLVMCSLTVHLTDTRPHSPPTSPSPTQAPSAVPVPPSEADHALTCAYHLLSFPICPVDIALYSHCFSACSDDARLRCTRVDAFIAGIAVSTSGHHFPSLQPPPAVHYYLSTADDRIKLVAEQVERVQNASYSQRRSNHNPSHTSDTATTVAPSDVARPLSQPCSRSSSAATTTLHSPSSRHPTPRSLGVCDVARPLSWPCSRTLS